MFSLRKSLKKSFFLLIQFFSIGVHFCQNSSADVDLTKLSNGLSGIDLRTGQKIQIQWDSVSLGTVIAFLSVKCPCSNSHEEALNVLAKDFEKSGFQFIGVHSNFDEDVDQARKHFNQSKFSFPVLQDSEAEIAIQFGALKTPHAYIVGRDKKILFEGGVDNSRMVQNATEHYLKDALTAIRDGNNSYRKSVRVVGCVISRP